MKYTVTIQGRAFEIEVRGGEARVDGQVVHAALHAIPGTPLRALTLPTGVTAYALARHDVGWTVHAGADVWDARVVDERTRRLQEVTGGGRAGGGHVAVKAPMPGRVVRLEVEVGSQVRQGQGLVVLEAMKMENELTSGIAGRVTAVHVQAGAAVAKGTVLVEVAAEG
ncbi:MAG: biotin/lipoyl-binding protein [Gemmatimonadota bacterium]|nr:biotin/lipoyl-binding protein [Gemmatimonadota bacterium]MDH5196786.1 biotin/lipoyl-binding protein [Gemmatimonadota bacterium]